MAVKLINIDKFETTTATKEKHVIAHLFASTKDDVNASMKVIGLPSDYILEAGSYARTATGDIVQLDFDGTWKVVGEEEDGTRASTLSLSKPAVTLAKQNFDTEEIEPSVEADEDDMR